MRPSAPIPQCLRPECLFSRFPPRATHSQGKYLVRLSCRTDAVAQVFSRNRVIFIHCSKKYYWPFEWFSKSSLIRCLPIRQEILNISQIVAAFHGIRPPFLIQTRLQQYSRCPFFYCAYCSLSNPTCVRSVWCRRTMMPG